MPDCHDRADQQKESVGFRNIGRRSAACARGAVVCPPIGVTLLAAVRTWRVAPDYVVPRVDKTISVVVAGHCHHTAGKPSVRGPRIWPAKAAARAPRYDKPSRGVGRNVQCRVWLRCANARAPNQVAGCIILTDEPVLAAQRRSANGTKGIRVPRDKDASFLVAGYAAGPITPRASELLRPGVGSGCVKLCNEHIGSYPGIWSLKIAVGVAYHEHIAKIVDGQILYRISVLSAQRLRPTALAVEIEAGNESIYVGGRFLNRTVEPILDTSQLLQKAGCRAARP